MPTNLYGEKDNFNQETGHVIPSLINKFYIAEQKGTDVNVWGSGKAKREFMYVKDLASALSYIMTLTDERFFFGDKFRNNHLNIGTGNEMTIKKLTLEISKHFNIQGKINFDKSMPEGVSKKLLGLPEIEEENSPNDDSKGDYKGTKDVNVYTCVKLSGNGWRWHQEANDTILPDSVGKAPKDKTPWLPLRFVTVDGEDYGRSRVKSSLVT